MHTLSGSVKQKNLQKRDELMERALVPFERAKCVALSFHFASLTRRIEKKCWCLSSGQLQRSYPDLAFAASPGGTENRTWDLLVVGRVLYH